MTKIAQRSFLRSINVQLDVGHPERVEHFRPTTKSARLISSMVRRPDGHALFVVAPYGSGKSIASSYVGHLVENRFEAAGMLRQVEARLNRMDAGLAKFTRRRRARAQRGLFVPLYGHQRSAPAALKEAVLDAMLRTKLGRQARSVRALKVTSAADLRKLLAVCSEKLVRSGRDRIVIVWDEFGRHLQGLVSEGRPEELDVLQVLAEIVSRSATVPVSLVLLLHRSLRGYATGLPAGLRREWAKVEGRFETLQYLDDSAELYELIGSLVSERRACGLVGMDFGEMAVASKRVGLFPNLSVERLASVLESGHPLAPVTLHLLPRVAARVAQNERTIFSFLEAQRLTERVPPSAIYEYFQGDFRSDAGAGGSQRAWLEAESALSKVPADSMRAEAVKAAFLLGLGLGGERGRATYDQLVLALGGPRDPGAATALEALIQKRLLVHRRHSDQVVVWHGTDLDLRGRLEDERARGTAEFAIVPFLSEEFPPPVWRPVEYNARFGLRRYCEAKYISVDGLAGVLAELELGCGWQPGTDGHVYYVLPENEKELVEARRMAEEIRDPRLLIAIAPDVRPLRDGALDLWCLLRMHADPELLRADPLASLELDHLTDDARTGLQPLVDRVLRPQNGGSIWHHMGRKVPIASVAGLRSFLSRVMKDVFPLTPEIHSEMVVRRKPTPVLVNARKKVELGLLERCGREDVGIEGNYADRAIFRCVFRRTGLYRRDGNAWRLAAPEELADEGLRAVWARMRRFFTEPGRSKSFLGLLNELMEPPYGVREGILPLLVAAGFRTFPTAATLRHRGRCVDDLLPSVVEGLVRNPSEYALDVLGLTRNQKTYLTGVLRLFGGNGSHGGPQDLLGACMTSVAAWRHTLSPAAANSRRVSDGARGFEQAVRSADPVHLFVEALPRLVGATMDDPVKLLRGAGRLKSELDGVAEAFRGEAVQVLGQLLVARGVASAGNGRAESVRAIARKWASFFPRSVAQHLPDRVAKGVLSRMRSRYRDEEALVNALSILLVGRSLHEWDDAVLRSFRRRLGQVLEVIEDAALGAGPCTDVDSELKNGLGELVEARARMAAERMAAVVGSDTAADRLEAMANVLRAQRSVPAEVA